MKKRSMLQIELLDQKLLGQLSGELKADTYEVDTILEGLLHSLRCTVRYCRTCRYLVSLYPYCTAVVIYQ